MASKQKQKQKQGQHGGKIEAQGGGTQEAETWNQDSPPTLAELLDLIDRLKAKLNTRQLNERAKGFDELVVFLQGIPPHGYGPSPNKSYPPRELNASDIRVDLAVFRGRICLE